MGIYVDLDNRGGGGEGPSEYVKSTSINGSTSVTFVDQDDTSTTFTPAGGETNNLITWSDTDVIALYDQRVFDEALYINYTGTVTTDNPSVDTTNWSRVGLYDVEPDRLLLYDETEDTTISDQRASSKTL